MKMQIFRIYFEAENHQPTILDELIPAEDGFHTFEYTDAPHRKAQLGIRVHHATEVICEQFHQTVARLTYNAELDIWYHQSKSWQTQHGDSHTDGIFGLNAGGTFKVIAYNDNNIIEETTVIITPGTMSLEEYIEMQEDVRHLMELFSYDLNDASTETEKLKSVQIRLYPLDTFSNILSETNKLLSIIEEAPEQTLTSVTIKQQPHQIKKWTAKTLIDAQKNPFKKIKTTQQIATFHIPEHQMIRKMLKIYEERIRMERNYEKRLNEQFKNEAQQLQVALPNVTGKTRTAVEAQWHSIKEDLELLADRKNRWINLERQLDTMLDLYYLQLPEIEEIEETFLFRMHPLYSEVYIQYVKYEELQPQYEEVLKSFVRSILKSPTLYEFWILLKIVAYFSEWGFSPKNFIHKLQKKLLEETQLDEFKSPDKLLSQFKMKFDSLNTGFKIGIWYDYERTNENGTLRPDYIIGFQNKHNPSHWVYHALDAKYKPYHQFKNGQALLHKDLLRSATRYVTQYTPSLRSATLIHPDLHETNWNIQDDEINPHHYVHQYGHFYFTPYHQENFRVYLRKLLHEMSDYENYCPSCGHHVNPIREEKPSSSPYFIKEKRTYICSNCQEVWVANYCGHCVNNPRTYLRRNGQILPTPLYKYATYNFNQQVGNSWNVHCPICSHTAPHN